MHYIHICVQIYLHTHINMHELLISCYPILHICLVKFLHWSGFESLIENLQYNVKSYEIILSSNFFLTCSHLIRYLLAKEDFLDFHSCIQALGLKCLFYFLYLLYGFYYSHTLTIKLTVLFFTYRILFVVFELKFKLYIFIYISYIWQ
jgi:hypothetical protein